MCVCVRQQCDPGGGEQRVGAVCVCIRHVIFMLVVRGIQNCEVQRLATTDLEGTVVKLQTFGVF